MVYCSQQFILFNVGSNAMRVTKNKTKKTVSLFISFVLSTEDPPKLSRSLEQKKKSWRSITARMQKHGPEKGPESSQKTKRNPVKKSLFHFARTSFWIWIRNSPFRSGIFFFSRFIMTWSFRWSVMPLQRGCYNRRIQVWWLLCGLHESWSRCGRNHSYE